MIHFCTKAVRKKLRGRNILSIDRQPHIDCFDLGSSCVCQILHCSYLMKCIYTCTVCASLSTCAWSSDFYPLSVYPTLSNTVQYICSKLGQERHESICVSVNLTCVYLQQGNSHNSPVIITTIRISYERGIVCPPPQKICAIYIICTNYSTYDRQCH